MPCFSHVAILVRDLDKSIDFYTSLFGMRVKWRNEEKAYLGLSEHDSLALLKGDQGGGHFDLTKITLNNEPTPNFYHFGPVATSEDEFNQLMTKVKGAGIKIAGPKISRDGTKSFYFNDSEGYTIQVLLPKSE